MATPVSILTLPADPVIGPVRRALRAVSRRHANLSGSYGQPTITVVPLVGIVKINPALKPTARTRRSFNHINFVAGKILWYGDSKRPRRGQLWPRTR